MEAFNETSIISIPSDPAKFSAYAMGLLSKIQELEDKVCLLEKKRFGPSSEKFVDPNQPSLFNEAEATSAEDDDDSEEEITVESHTRKVKRKKKIDLSLVEDRQTTVHELDESERACDCCGNAMHEIGEEKTEKLEVIPAKLSVQEDVYKKYACKIKQCNGKVKQAPVAPSAIPKIKATMGTLAFIAVQKYLYGTPLYRLEFLFSVLGVTLSRYVMSKWMIKLAFAFKPIYLTLEEKALESDYIHIDETSLQVLKEKGRKPTTKSFAWVRRSGDPNAPPIVLFHYSPTRSATVAKELLSGFKGYLQTDDYIGYTCALGDNDNIQQLLCWDHTRRYFKDAYDAIPKKNRGGGAAEQILKLIAKLYKTEKRAKDLSPSDRLKLRQEESVETIQKIKSLCDSKLPTLSTKSLTTKAIKYTLDNIELLQVYTTNPMLNISNCPAEQAIRPFVVGRKNWLFSCTPEGAEASMIIYSLIITAKANGLSPFEYLKNTLLKLPFVKTADDLEKLLPLAKTS